MSIVLTNTPTIHTQFSILILTEKAMAFSENYIGNIIMLKKQSENLVVFLVLIF